MSKKIKIEDVKNKASQTAKDTKEKASIKVNKIKDDAKSVVEDPILATKPLDSVKLPVGAKVLAILCIVQCVFSAPVAYSYISIFILEFSNGALANHSTSSIILYFIFSIGIVALIALMIAIGVNMLLNKRRISAILATITAIVAAIASVADILIVGIAPEIFVLIIAIILLVVLKSYIDPSLSEERKLQSKLRKMENKSEAEKGILGFSKEEEGRPKMNYFNIFWLFFIMCIIGYILEIIWHMTVDNPGVYEERAGFLFGPFSPIYGFGAAIISLILNRFVNKNVIIVFIISALLGGFFEYLVSVYLEYCFGVKSWDYSHLPFNIDGRTSLRFFIIWGIIGIIWVKVLMRPMIKLINKMPWKFRYSVTIIASAFMLLNMVMTFQALDCWYTRNAGHEPVTPVEKFYAECFNDDFMHKRFENMKMDPSKALRGTESNSSSSK